MFDRDLVVPEQVAASHEELHRQAKAHRRDYATREERRRSRLPLSPLAMLQILALDIIAVGLFIMLVAYAWIWFTP